MLTEDERAEKEILDLMTPDTKKFGIEIGYKLTQSQQDALERLQLRDWIRLIDISPVTAGGWMPLRVFRVMPDAVAWHQAQEE